MQKNKPRPYAVLLPCSIYKGKCANLRLTGNCDNLPNITALMLLAAKFGNDKSTLKKMAIIMAHFIEAEKYDYITGANNRDSNIDMGMELATRIADLKKIPYLKLLYNGNAACKSEAKGKRILIIDDVIYQGKTMNKCVAAAKKAGAESVDFFAFGKSSNYP